MKADGSRNMKLSKRGEYGIRALCHLAGSYGRGVVQIREIAREESIPPKFLEGILLELKRFGFVRSRRGVEGGYALAKDPKTIMLGDVVRALDGPLGPMGGASELQGVLEQQPRQAGFYSLMMDVRNAVSDILDQTSVEQVMQRTRELTGDA